MRVSCLQENLAKGLSVVGRAVATRSTLPVLSNVMLSTDNGRLKPSATDLEIGINCWIGAKVEEDGATTVQEFPLIPSAEEEEGTITLKADAFREMIELLASFIRLCLVLGNSRLPLRVKANEPLNEPR